MRGEPLDRLARTRDQRQPLPIASLHPPHDLLGDLVGRLGKPDDLVHVARPLGRAHAHHVRLRAVRPLAAALARQLFSHLVPEPLRVEEQPVEIEDDGVDHAGT